jgi:hypothetical protein
MMVELTSGDNFTNILQAAFFAQIPKVQQDSQLISGFLRYWDLQAQKLFI